MILVPLPCSSSPFQFLCVTIALAEPDTLLVIGSAKVGGISGAARGDRQILLEDLSKAIQVGEGMTA